MLALIIAGLVGAPLAPPQVRPTVVLAENTRTVFLLPLDSMVRGNAVVGAVVVSVYESPGEPWEEVRRDTFVELDCTARRVRSVSEIRYNLEDRAINEQSGDGLWVDIGGFRPFQALAAIMCDGQQAAFGEPQDFAEVVRAARARLDERLAN